jgi:putative DNA primase/helicase
MHVPNDSTYLYRDRGYWKTIQSDYLEAIAMERLAKDGQVRAGRCSEVRKLVQLKCLIPLDRQLNELNGYVNLQNGMLNVETHELHPHRKDHLSTIQLPVDYNEKASCPRWHQFLDEIFEADEERVNLVQEYMGYSLVPDTRYEKALLGVGEGSNGKSTLLGVWEHMIGRDNFCSVTLGNLQNEFHRVKLYGKLLNVAAEVRNTTLEQADYFKRIVTGDTIDAAHKHKPVFHFRPFARLVFAMNRMPRIKDTSHGFYRRLLILPFNRVFSEKEQDRQLRQKLIQEIDGIFQWALKGLERLYDNDGFTEPQVVREALAAYQRANNPLVAFVEDCCNLDTEFSTSKDTLYGEYKKYCDEYGFKPGSASTFFKELYAQYPSLVSARPRTEQGREYAVEGIVMVKKI